MITPDQVKEARARLRLSRRNFGEAVGLTESRIWAIENGKTIQTIEHVNIENFLLNRNGEPADVPAVVPPLPDPGLAPADILQEAGEQILQIPVAGQRPAPREDLALFSNSQMTTWQDCRRKWWLAWYRNLQLKTEVPVGARAVGDRIHRALQLYYVPDGYSPLDPRTGIEFLIASDWAKLNQDAALTKEYAKKFTDEANLERVIIEGYVQWLADEGEDQGLTVIAPEAYISAPFFDGEWLEMGKFPWKDIQVIGKLDVRVRHEPTGKIMFLDHKVVGEMTTPTKMLPLDPQMKTYHLLEWLNAERSVDYIDAALYNMLRRVKRTANATPPFYRRPVVHRNIMELKTHEDHIKTTIIEILDATVKLDDGADHHTVAPPRPSRDCTWKCDFFKVCPMFDDGSRAEDMLQAYYEEHDPLSYYGEVKEEG